MSQGCAALVIITMTKFVSCISKLFLLLLNVKISFGAVCIGYSATILFLRHSKSRVSQNFPGTRMGKPLKLLLHPPLPWIMLATARAKLTIIFQYIYIYVIVTRNKMNAFSVYRFQGRILHWCKKRKQP